MANGVIAKKTSYDGDAVLTQIHTEILSAMESSIKEIDALVGEGKSFNSPKINKMIKQMTDVFNKQIVKKLKTNFVDSEKIAKKMAEKLEKEDYL